MVPCVNRFRFSKTHQSSRSGTPCLTTGYETNPCQATRWSDDGWMLSGTACLTYSSVRHGVPDLQGCQARRA